MTPGIEKFSSGIISISDPPKTKLDPRTVFHYLKTSEKGIGAVEMSFGGKLVPIGYFRRTTDGGFEAWDFSECPNRFKARRKREVSLLLGNAWLESEIREAMNRR